MPVVNTPCYPAPARKNKTTTAVRVQRDFGSEQKLQQKHKKIHEGDLGSNFCT